ncbi:DUF6079 family protein [Carboxydocella sp. ULO1]|uniref:DUF6079 family protein n=1 Tax=Carboxydocella sp. ULO1 TaxID=1926599 RepID=UPI0009ACD04B|nr:DUF6079 family protein [Carboxydocella sp. ULO1]GAW28762.1 hypothetical protein ULO1_13320 [Carboxydocella sp. ULO1]
MERKNLSEFIRVSPGFQYSVNIKYDLKNKTKITNYIPLTQSVEIFDEVIKATQPNETKRSRLIVGSYGTGKSHLCTVLTSILAKTFQKNDYKELISKINNISPAIANVVLEELADKKILPVIINGNDSAFEQSLLYNLHFALKEEGIENIMPQTVYKAAFEQIYIWKENYPDAFKRLYEFLNASQYSVEKLLFELENYYEESYLLFERAYSYVTHGAQFQPLLNGKADEIYLEVLYNLPKDKYKGIIVIFDEFGKYLENQWKNNQLIDLKPVQDFAEACNASGEMCLQLLLITHKPITQYALKYGQEVVNEWKKIEGRFKIIELINQPQKNYEIISQVILKDQNWWNEFEYKNKEKFLCIKDALTNTSLFSDMNEADFNSIVIKGGYPLHPLATFCLPRFTQKIAQNERTLFTFLTTNDFYSLGEFLIKNNPDNFNLLTIDTLYDYFEHQLKTLDPSENIYQIWLQTASGLARLNKDELVEARLLKALAVIKMVGLPTILPPNKEMLKIAFLGTNLDSEQINKAIQNLFNKRILFEGSSTGNLEIIEKSEIDVKTELELLLAKRRRIFDFIQFMNEKYRPKPVLAKRYNDKYAMTRYFLSKYISSKDMNNIAEYLDENFDKDGYIFYLLIENEDDFEETVKLIKKDKYERAVFVLPKKPLEKDYHHLEYILRSIDSLNLLLKNLEESKNFSKADRIEVLLWIDEFENKLNNLLNEYFSIQDCKVYAFGTERKIINAADLNRLVSEVCETIFNKTPVFNNEMMNKHEITAPIIKARKKIVEGLLQPVLTTNLGINGNGPEMAIFRSLLLHKGIINFDNENTVLNDISKIKDPGVVYCLQKLGTLLYESRDGIRFDQIIKHLCSAPIGLRKGIIPIVIAIFLHGRTNDFILSEDGIEKELSADNIELAFKNPEKFYLIMQKWSEEKSVFCNALKGIFSEYINEYDKLGNPTRIVYNAIKRWFLSLPKFTRDSKNLGPKAKELRRLLKQANLQSAKFLFEDLPKIIIGENRVCYDQIKIIVREIEAIKREMDYFLEVVIKNLEEEMINTLPSETRTKDSLLSSLRTWYFHLSEQQRERIYSDGTQAVLDLIATFNSENKSEFTKKLLLTISGLRPEDWSDLTVKNIVPSFIEIIKEVDLFKDVTNEIAVTSEVMISYIDQNGNKINRKFYKSTISPTGELLKNLLEGFINEYGDAITNNEKRQIVISLLEKLM